MKKIVIYAIVLMFGLYAYSDQQALNDSSYTIEAYQADRDWEAVKKIINDYPEYLKYELLGFSEGTTTFLLSKESGWKTDVIRVNGQTVGFVLYGRKNEYFLTFFLERWGLVNLLGIDKDHHRKGYGTLLIRQAIKELKKRKVPVIRLVALENNPQASALYEKEGFVLVKKYLDLGRPARLYEYYLDIPAAQLPQGNIIQRHPNKFYLTLGAVGFMVSYMYARLKRCEHSKRLHEYY